MDLYLSEIVADELASKSPEQVKNFSKIKRRAVANFVAINGDIDMRDITREHAHAVRKFWHERIHPKDGFKPMSGSSGNKDLTIQPQLAVGIGPRLFWHRSNQFL